LVGYDIQQSKFDGVIHFYYNGIFYPFWGTPGVKRGTKWGKPAHLLTNSNKNLHIWLDMIFNRTNLMVASIFIILEYFANFGAPQGSKGAQNGVNLPIFSQIVIKAYKFGRI